MKKVFGFASMLVAFCAASVFTSCSDDDDDEEIAELSGITAVANANGTITIKGSVISETRLKSLTITNVKTGEETDLLEEKNIKEKDENGVKTFTTTLKEVELPVDIYTLSANLRKTGKGAITIGENYELLAGAGSKSALGSYISLKNINVYTKDQAESLENSGAEIEVVCNNEANFIKSTAALNANNMQYPTTKIFNSNSRQEVDNATAGTIISSDGVIATFSVDKDSETDNATIKGVRIVSTSNLVLDLSILD